MRKQVNWLIEPQKINDRTSVFHSETIFYPYEGQTVVTFHFDNRSSTDLNVNFESLQNQCQFRVISLKCHSSWLIGTRKLSSDFHDYHTKFTWNARNDSTLPNRNSSYRTDYRLSSSAINGLFTSIFNSEILQSRKILKQKLNRNLISQQNF